MFSSLTSFLPSALQNIGNNQPPPPSFEPVDDGDPDNDDDQVEPERRPSEEEAGTGAKKVSKRGPNETFIFVRPPPAKTNHPLNLQVQLVPPTAASRTYRQSIDGDFSNANDSSVSLTRTQSNRSDTSSYGSTASFASTASTSSTSARRTIIPLYNLQAHNVMTNTIVDAGTDAKVAKFQRRGIEVIDLVFLEPVEVWGERNPTRTATAPPAPGQTGKTSRPVTPSDTAGGPGSSTTSLHSASHTNDQASISSHTPSHLHQTPTQAQVPIIAAPTSKRSTIFGKLFKKPNKDSSSSSSTTSLAASPATHAQASSIVFTRPSAEEATPTQSTPNPGAITPKAFITSATTSQTRRASHIRNLSASLTPPSFVERLSGVKGISGGKGDKSTGRGGTERGRSASPQPPLVGLGLGGLGLGRSVTSSSSAASTSNGHGVSEDGMLLPPQQSFHNTSSSDLPNEEREKEKEKERILRPPVLGVQPTLSFSYAPGMTATVPPPPSSGSSTSGSNTGSSGTNAAAGGSVAGGSALASGAGNGQASGYPTGAMMKSARALMYVWFVRKWLKRRKDVRASFLAGWSAHGQQQQQHGEVDVESAGHGAEGSFGGAGGLLGIMRGSARNSILGGVGAESAVVAATVQSAPGEGVEVRFEWRRSNAKKKRGKGGEREKERDGDVERRGRRRSLKLAGTRESNGGAGGEAAEASRLTKRPSVVSHQGSLSTSFSISDEGGGNGNGGAGAGPLTQSPARKGSSRTGTPTRDKDSDKARDRTGSFSLPRGRTPERVASLGGLSIAGAADDGEESDPEDSETPWVCTLKIRRVGGSSASVASASGSGSSSVPAPAAGSASTRSRGKAGKVAGQGRGGEEGSSSGFPAAPQVLKVKVGTLSPTPHHPKVVAMLKVPFPLPDVEVEKMVVRKRTGAGHSRPPSSQVDPQWGAGGLTLSAEEIKDVVCSTGLWLVVREGFGGVGKVTRKGDGWRIRA